MPTHDSSAVVGSIEELRPRDLAPARTLGERLSAVGAFGALVAIDLVSRLGGFGALHGLVRRWPRWGRSSENSAEVSRVCLAVDRAASYYFKKAWCLQRSATTTCLLRLKGFDAHMVIGVAKMPFRAHAWVQVGTEVVNDHPMIRNQYTVIDRC